MNKNEYYFLQHKVSFLRFTQRLLFRLWINTKKIIWSVNHRFGFSYSIQFYFYSISLSFGVGAFSFHPYINFVTMYLYRNDIHESVRKIAHWHSSIKVLLFFLRWLNTIPFGSILKMCFFSLLWFFSCFFFLFQKKCRVSGFSLFASVWLVSTLLFSFTSFRCDAQPSSNSNDRAFTNHERAHIYTFLTFEWYRLQDKRFNFGKFFFFFKNKLRAVVDATIFQIRFFFSISVFKFAALMMPMILNFLYELLALVRSIVRGRHTHTYKNK